MRKYLVTAALAVWLGGSLALPAPARACDFGGSFGGSFGGNGLLGQLLLQHFLSQQSFSQQSFGGGFDLGGGFDGYGLGAQSFAIQPQFHLHLNSRAFVPPVATPFGGGNFAFRGRVRGRSFTPGFGGNLRFRGRVRGGFGGGFCPGCFP